MQYPILTLFDDGAAQAFDASQQNTNTSQPDGVKVGENTASSDENDGDDRLEEEFEELIRNKYNKAFTKKTAAIISKRFHENKSEEKSDNNARHGEDIKNNIRQTERAAGVYATWERESEILKNEYPEFDLKIEAKNPRFISLIKAGTSIKDAYEVTHKETLMPEKLKNAIYNEVNRVWLEIEERKSRPEENGILGTSNPVTKRSVGSLSKSERESLERRAIRGEKIIL